jgi:hypothetical protein
MERLKDCRPIITTLSQADQVMAEIARLECAVAVADAKAEKRVAEIKAANDAATLQDRTAMAGLKAALGGFIESNRNLFDRPRKRRTAFGSYGLQTVSELVVTNPDAVLADLIQRGYEDCLKTVRSLVKPAIAARLQDGETLPNCCLFSGDTAVMKVSKSIIDEAREQAL